MIRLNSNDEIEENYSINDDNKDISKDSPSIVSDDHSKSEANEGDDQQTDPNDPLKDAYLKANFLANTCMKFGMYEDACRYADEMVKLRNNEPSEEDCNLVVSCYRFFISEKRTSWRNLSLMDNREQNVKLMNNEIRTTYEDFIIKACERLIALINNFILNKVKTDRNFALFLRVKADHYRYMAEVTYNQNLFNNKQNAFELYKQAYELSSKLDILDVVRLSIALNYSVFLYEILHKRLNSIFYAKEALSRALSDLKGFTAEQISDERFKESLNIIEILNENVHTWYKEEMEESARRDKDS
jgi:14-3-3 protein epsilon